MTRLNTILCYPLLLMLFIGCGDKQSDVEPDIDNNDFLIDKPYITVEKKYDDETGTIYYLSRIPYKDSEGRILKLRHAFTTEDYGETVPEFSERIGNPLLVINASAALPLPYLRPDPSARGVQIADGYVLQDLTTRNYILGIEDDNRLRAYWPNTRAQAILDDGVNNALTAFTPLIIDHEPVPNDILALVSNYPVANPRQVIAQLDNLDLVILSCGGRGYDGRGLKAPDIIRILQGLEDNIKFAYNLDGGGSTTTVVYGDVITKMIDSRGTEYRKRADFLYIEEND